MSETAQHETGSVTNPFWPYLNHDVRRELCDMAREARYSVTPADLRPVLATFHDPANSATGLLALFAQIFRELSGNLDEQTPHHKAVREALDQAATHIADTAAQHIATALDLLTRPTAQDWPTPEQAYAKAPSTISEIGWTARTAAERPFGSETSREFWLRKAALLDRIALADEHVGEPGDATEAADRAARRLMDVDDAAVICDPRHYVRQQYARWITHQ
ncbi:hypothetical protein [Streptomyces sp. NRRL B-24572]|uniref:hypothetical protein n=1 Tax=Streptomyces sp. NRRL B-24572 TaxID=1962156 RepID=UPI0015C4FC73|nr:hypothetical protein [Streptomyces sp. NRRL B-24572]